MATVTKEEQKMIDRFPWLANDMEALRASIARVNEVRARRGMLPLPSAEAV